MYWYLYLPTHTYYLSNSFTLRLVSPLLHTDELHINIWQKYLINFNIHHLGITYKIMFKDLLTPMTLSVHYLLYHISIGTLESSPFGFYVLVSSLFRYICVVSSFYILYPLHFLICPIILLVGYWPKPLYDLDLSTASKTTCMVLPGGDEDNYLHSEPNWSSFICIQGSSGKYHNWNLSLFRRSGLTYPDGDIKSSTITQGSQFPTTGNTI